MRFSSLQDSQPAAAGLFAEGAFSQAFVPILAEYKSRRGHDATRDLVDQVATLLALILLVVSVNRRIGRAGADLYSACPVFCRSASKFDRDVDLLRPDFSLYLLHLLVSLAEACFNTYSKFSVPAFTPVLLNLSFIGCALWLAPYFDPPVLVLGVAVLLGGLLQLGFQLPYLAKLGAAATLPPETQRRGCVADIEADGPAVFGVSISQISLLINTSSPRSW